MPQSPAPTLALPQANPEAAVPKCKKGHQLVRQAPGFSSWISTVTCDSCQSSAYSAGDLWTCKACNYDNCGICAANPTCSKGHKLKKVSVGLSSWVSGMACDVCKKSPWGSGCTWCCRSCDYDVCGDCMMKQSLSQKSTSATVSTTSASPKVSSNQAAVSTTSASPKVSSNQAVVSNTCASPKSASHEAAVSNAPSEKETDVSAPKETHVSAPVQSEVNVQSPALEPTPHQTEKVASAPIPEAAVEPAYRAEKVASAPIPEAAVESVSSPVEKQNSQDSVALPPEPPPPPPPPPVENAEPENAVPLSETEQMKKLKEETLARKRALEERMAEDAARLKEEEMRLTEIRKKIDEADRVKQRSASLRNSIEQAKREIRWLEEETARRKAAIKRAEEAVKHAIGAHETCEAKLSSKRTECQQLEQEMMDFLLEQQESEHAEVQQESEHAEVQQESEQHESDHVPSTNQDQEDAANGSSNTAQ